jgi:hypothetical protein
MTANLMCFDTNERSSCLATPGWMIKSRWNLGVPAFGEWIVSNRDLRFGLSAIAGKIRSGGVASGYLVSVFEVHF